MNGAPTDVQPTDGEEPDLVFPQANFMPVRAIALILESTLGPTPLDALIVNQLAARTERDSFTDNLPTDDFTVTGDGKTILDELPLQHPVAPIVRRIAGPERPGDSDIKGGADTDGVTTAIVLLNALLDEAEALMELGLHPAEITSGYEAALEVATGTLSDAARQSSSFADERAILTDVARTAMTGNDVGGFADEWAELAVTAVEQVGAPGPTTLAVRQLSSGTIADSRLVYGAVLDRNEVAHMDMPHRADDATVLVIDGQDEGGLRFDDPPENVTATLEPGTSIKAFDDARSAKRQQVLADLVDYGVDVVVTRQGIDTEYERLLADAGIMGVDGVTQLDIQHVVNATGASPVLKSDDFDESDFGRAGTVREEIIEPRRHRRKNRRMVLFEGCEDPGTVTLVLRGVFGQIADQATVQVRTAASAVSAAVGNGSCQPGIVAGGGAADVEVVRTVVEAAKSVDDRSQLAMNGFADAVESVVVALVRNSCGDPLAVVPELRAAHNEGQTTVGYHLPSRTVADTLDAGVLDPLDVRIRALVSATEVARVLLKIDDTLDATFEEEIAGPEDSIYDEQAEVHSDS